MTGIAAVWTISGLSGISVTGNIGLLAASNNPRITTTDTSGITPSSTITITGFTVADNRGAIQCINLADGKVQGTATISIGTPLYYFRAMLSLVMDLEYLWYIIPRGPLRAHHSFPYVGDGWSEHETRMRSGSLLSCNGIYSESSIRLVDINSLTVNFLFIYHFTS